MGLVHSNTQATEATKTRSKISSLLKPGRFQSKKVI